MPEYVTSSAAFLPALTPLKTRSGKLPFIKWFKPKITQSVGVPSTSNSLLLLFLTFISFLRVIDLPAPDLSFFGAKTQISSEISSAMDFKILNPGASIPSSLTSNTLPTLLNFLSILSILIYYPD